MTHDATTEFNATTWVATTTTRIWKSNFFFQTRNRSLCPRRERELCSSAFTPNISACSSQRPHPRSHRWPRTGVWRAWPCGSVESMSWAVVRLREPVQAPRITGWWRLWGLQGPWKEQAGVLITQNAQIFWKPHLNQLSAETLGRAN